MTEEVVEGLSEDQRTALVDALVHMKNKLTSEDVVPPRLRMAGE